MWFVVGVRIGWLAVLVPAEGIAVATGSGIATVAVSEIVVKAQ
jgi:hypothetical protein